jgi:hypothetical protein
MSPHHLAQLNVVALREPLESPALADFVANLARIDAIADASPGFVWRLQTEEGNATSLRPLGDDVLINMSVWEDVASLHAYVYHSEHAAMMRRRREWAVPIEEAHMVLWWVPAGHRPSVDEGIERLSELRDRGPRPAAFTFKRAFPPPGAHQIPSR